MFGRSPAGPSVCPGSLTGVTDWVADPIPDATTPDEAVPDATMPGVLATNSFDAGFAVSVRRIGQVRQAARMDSMVNGMDVTASGMANASLVGPAMRLRVAPGAGAVSACDVDAFFPLPSG